MKTKFNQSVYLALVLIFCTFGLIPEARAEQDKSDDARSLVAQENQDNKREEESEPPKLKGIPKQIDKIAQKITVRIDSPDGNGSGVIFARDGDRYYVVTAKHVVEAEQNYQIVTEKEEVYDIAPADITKLPNTDLAIAFFTSEKNYHIAAFSDYNLGLNKEYWVFVYGWAKTQAEPESLFTVGKVIGKETGIFLVKDELSLDKTNGYELVYTNLAERGMSGGPVLDTTGRVIGIHTSAEGERYRLVNKLQLGFSLGVGIGTFLESPKLQTLTRSRNLELQTIKERADSSPFSKPDLTREDLDSVATNFLNTPKEDATETEWVNYGNKLWRTARYAEAVTAFDNAIAKKTDFHQAYYGKGLALSDLGKYGEADLDFKRAVDLEPNFYPALYRKSLSLLNLRQYPQALKIIDHTIALKPENTALYALRGDALQNLERYDEAIDAYSKAIAQDNNPLILTRRSSIYRILGKHNLALKDLNQAIKFDPRYTEGYINRGLTYYRLEDYQQALINLNHAARVDHLDPRVYLARGFVHQKLGEKTQAQADFIRAFNLYDRKQVVTEESNEIELRDERYNHLNIDFYQMMQSNQADANINFGQGIAYLLLDDRQQAIATLTQAQEQFKSDQDRFAENYAQKIISQARQPRKPDNNLAEN